MRTATVIFLFSVFAFSCKCRHKAAADANPPPQTTVASNNNAGYISATGKISLKNKSCGAVIITLKEKDTLTLIPMPALSGFDKEGEEVSFAYRQLRVHNPRGCAGIPVQISEIKKK